MIREQVKIHEEVLPQFITNKNDKKYVEEIERKCGTIEEQCFRIMAVLSGQEASYDIFGNQDSDKEYNKSINLWIRNHPFINNNGKQFENIVFEDYVLTNLIIKGRKYSQLAYQWLEMSYSESYLFWDIYNHSVENKEIDYELVPYLLTSFKALDTPTSIGTTEIFGEDVQKDTTYTKCELTFSREGKKEEYEFSFHQPKDKPLQLPPLLSAVNIDAPVDVGIEGTKIEFIPYVEIRCRKLSLVSKDVIQNSYKSDAKVVIECDEFSALASDKSIPNVTARFGKDSLLIFTQSPLHYPFFNYKATAQQYGFGEDSIKERFIKLRRMLLMFRSHSKGVLARYRDKIDSRIGKTPQGRAMIDKLLEEKVLLEDDQMYYINNDRFAAVLGVKYDYIRSCEINEKTRLFLQRIVDDTAG